jgi:hypothetical protein
MAAGGKKKKGAERMGASTNLPGKSRAGSQKRISKTLQQPRRHG